MQSYALEFFLLQVQLHGGCLKLKYDLAHCYFYDSFVHV